MSELVVVKQSSDGDTRSRAWFSEDERYRYALQRSWNTRFGGLCFILLNPSTADETKDDPTVARCMKKARREGYGYCTILNLFAFRATNPKVMKAVDDPVGENNDNIIDTHAYMSQRVIVAWGGNGVHMNRDNEVLAMLTKNHRLYALKENKDGTPAHPLYQKGNLKEFLWRRRGEALVKSQDVGGDLQLL